MKEKGFVSNHKYGITHISHDLIAAINFEFRNWEAMEKMHSQKSEIFGQNSLKLSAMLFSFSKEMSYIL